MLRNILCAGLVAGASLTAQADLYVDQSVPIGVNDGLSWATAFPTLDQALIASSPGDEIWVATGIYTPRQLAVPGVPRSATFPVRRNITVIGGFAGTETSFSQWPALPCVLNGEVGNLSSTADNLFHIVTAENDAFGSSLRGFTFTGGNADGGTVTGGGAILAFNNSFLQVADCDFSGNLGIDGGAIYINQIGGVLLKRCTFTDNFATDDGGAIAAVGAGAALGMVNCVFLRNTARNRGGAIVFFRSAPGLDAVGTATVTNCVFARNAAGGRGGAVFVRRGIDFGGGVTSPGSAAFFYQCTFFKNESRTEGGAIFADTTFPIPAVVEVNNCILWNNAAPLAPQYGGGGPALFSNIQGGYPGTGNINSDPLFVNPGADDYRLQLGSPSIDTGNDSLVPPDFLDVDDDGVFALQVLPLDLGLLPRIQNVVDMGAHEQGDT